MVLDFLMSRWIMMVGAAVLIGGVIGIHQTFTAIPEDVNKDRFARDWTAPILAAYSGVGQYDGDTDPTIERGRHIVFSTVVVERELDTRSAPYHPYKRVPHYDGKGFVTKIYRDAILLEWKDETIRIALPDVSRTQLWYASNADTYTKDDEDWINARTANPLIVDYTKPLVVRRNLNAEGTWNVYISQLDWLVFPKTCHREVLAIAGRPDDVTDTCTPRIKGEPVFVLMDSNEARIGNADLAITKMNVTMPTHGSRTNATGVLTLPGPAPDPHAEAWRVGIEHPGLKTAAILPVTYTRNEVS